MKWNNELDEKLKTLIELGKNYKEISTELNTTQRSISNRTFRLNLKSQKIHREIILCKNCGKTIDKTISNEKVFCCHSCSAKYNNIGRKHSESTKNKIRDFNLGKTYPQRRVSPRQKLHKIKNRKIICGNTTNNIKYLEIKYRKCRCCNKNKFILKHKIICETCSIDYYKIYRPLCKFNFNISKYKDEFDFNLVNKYGWYSPTNKKNNLNGVSKDHIYSVKDGFLNKIDYNIIKHPANCALMKHTDNNLKNSQSLITIDELLQKIEIWNEKHKE